MRADKSNETFNLYFDGHLSFANIIENLIQDHGLGRATHVLLTVL